MAKAQNPNAETARRPRRGAAKQEISAATQTVPPPAPPPPPPPADEDDPDLITDEELEDLADFNEATEAETQRAKDDPRTLPRKARLPETEFFQFVKGYPRELADNLMFYVYRTEPAIKSKRRDPITGRIITNIDKVPNADQITQPMILNKWGSGKYRVIMTDQGKKGKATKQICDCVFSVNEWDKFPPVFTDPTELVDCSANASLINGLVANKTLKRDVTGALIMHDGATTPGATSTDSTETVRVVMASNERMLDRFDRMMSQDRRAGGSKIEEAVAALVLTQVNRANAPEAKAAADPMMTFLLNEVSEARKENRELMGKLLDMSNAPRKESNPLSVIAEFAGTLKELSGAGLFPGLGGADKAAAPWWETAAEKLMPFVGPKIADLLTPKQAPLPGQTPQQQQTTAPAAAAIAAPAAPVQDHGIPVENTSTQSPGQPAAAPPPAQAAAPTAPPPEAIQYLAGQVANLLQRNGMNGQDLAHSIFVMHGPQGLISIRQFPRETIQQLMLKVPTVGAVLDMMKEDYQNFMEEFYNYDPTQNAEEDEPAAAAAQAA